MRIDQYNAGFSALRGRSASADTTGASGRAGSQDDATGAASAPGRTEITPQTALDRVAAENAAAALSKIRAAAVAERLSALVTDRLAEAPQRTLGLHSGLSAENVAALLRS